MRDRGFQRVSVMVPADYVQWVRAFAQLLRNASPDDLCDYREELETYLRDCYAAYDEDVALGRYTDPPGSDDD